ncbi:hypothetical protein BJ912DRAFT_937830 [Pholiota molesta]|nr:hypothetical protein BJ912DRAFT_937830 [Pholiota molesta]
MAINHVSMVDGLHFHHHHVQTTPTPPFPSTKDVGSIACDDGTGVVDTKGRPRKWESRQAQQRSGCGDAADAMKRQTRSRSGRTTPAMSPPTTRPPPTTTPGMFSPPPCTMCHVGSPSTSTPQELNACSASAIASRSMVAWSPPHHDYVQDRLCTHFPSAARDTTPSTCTSSLFARKEVASSPVTQLAQPPHLAGIEFVHSRQVLGSWSALFGALWDRFISIDADFDSEYNREIFMLIAAMVDALDANY